MLTLPPALTLSTAAVCLQALRAQVLAASDAVVVDAAGLTQFDSAALAVLLAVRRDAQAAGKPFSVTGLPPRLSDLARLYGITELLTPV